MAGDEFGYDPTMMGEWNEAADERRERRELVTTKPRKPIKRNPPCPGLARVEFDAEICAYCGEPSRRCECWS